MLSVVSRVLTRLVVAATVVVSVTVPSEAFEIFGIHLFGEKDAAEDVVDPVNYSAIVAVAADGAELTDAMSEGSLLVRRQNEPPSGTIGLISRAKDDQANLLALLYEHARYGATVTIIVGGRALDEISVADELQEFAGKVPVTINIDPGPVFSFERIVISGPNSPEAGEAAAEVGLREGEPAHSTRIAAAETAITAAWRRAGHPFADVSNHDVVADHQTRRLDVTLQVRPGGQARLGHPTISGTERLSSAFLERQADVPVGAVYHPTTVERVRKNLAKLDAIASVSVDVARDPGPDGLQPLLIEVSERKRRTIGAGAEYSSTEGLNVQTFWLHRNLFGEAESLRLDARVGRLLEAGSLDEYDALFSVLYSVPGFWHPANRLDLKATAIQEDPDPYNRRGFVFETALTHEFNEQLVFKGGVTYDWARIDDAFGRNSYSIVSLPLEITYDSRNSKLDPTSGIYSSLRIEPQIETGSSALFVMTDAEVRTYLALDDAERFVLAARGVAGTITGAGLADIPAHRRFYAGGGGSVRGYDYLNVGPRIAGFGATGGLSRIEASLEARVKLTDTIGIVPFVDAGLVTAGSAFSGNDDFQIGVGLGLRYYTSVGPIRLDVAVPLDPRSGDPDFAIYAGIGQSF
jgi:translocation and assembly module TamA